MPLAIAALALLALAGLLWLLSGRAHRGTGLPAGEVVYSDTGGWTRPPKALFSKRLRLAGKPDYLVRQRGAIVPVEVKSMRAPAGEPHAAHVYQLAAYCALVAETYGQRPAYGLIKYADSTVRVDYTPALEADFEALLDEITAELKAGAPELHRSHEIPARCRACGFREVCAERLE